MQLFTASRLARSSRNYFDEDKNLNFDEICQNLQTIYRDKLLTKLAHKICRSKMLTKLDENIWQQSLQTKFGKKCRSKLLSKFADNTWKKTCWYLQNWNLSMLIFQNVRHLWWWIFLNLVWIIGSYFPQNLYFSRNT